MNRSRNRIWRIFPRLDASPKLEYLNLSVVLVWILVKAPCTSSEVRDFSSGVSFFIKLSGSRHQWHTNETLLRTASLKLGRMKTRSLKLARSPCAWGKSFNRIHVQTHICLSPVSQEGYDSWLWLSLVNRAFSTTFCLGSFSSKYICSLLHIHEIPVMSSILIKN